jgi:hypothetical protein
MRTVAGDVPPRAPVPPAPSLNQTKSTVTSRFVPAVDDADPSDPAAVVALAGGAGASRPGSRAGTGDVPDEVPEGVVDGAAIDGAVLGAGAPWAWAAEAAATDKTNGRRGRRIAEQPFPAPSGAQENPDDGDAGNDEVVAVRDINDR